MNNNFKTLCKILKCPNCDNKHLILIRNYYFCNICHSKFRIKNEIYSFLPKKLTKASRFEKERFSDYVKYYKRIDFFQSEIFLEGFKKNIIPLIRGKKLKILEIGCGPVAYSRYYKNVNNNCEIFVCDLNERILQASKHFDEYGKVDYYFISDILNLPFQDNTFDYVIGVSVLHHISEIENAIKEIFRVLKRGGYYLGIYEPISCNLFKKILLILNPKFRSEEFQYELIRDYNTYYNLFNNKMKYLKIKIIKRDLKKYKDLKKYRTCIYDLCDNFNLYYILYFYRIFSKILPLNIMKHLGGSLVIISRK